jgi:CBS domain-containing protein
MSSQTRIEGSYRTPAFEHAQVSDVMRTGVLTCAPETTLETVARMMVTNHIHCVVVTTSADARDQAGPPWGIVSDLDLAAAAGDRDRTAGDVCATDVVTVEPDESLERAAQLMVEHESAHLVVVDRKLDIPVGVLSTLDVAGALAWGQA